MEKITVFDVEVLNQDPSSICSIGLVELVDGKIKNTFYSLIQPAILQKDHARYRVHHISIQDLIGQPTFDEVWKKIASYFEHHIVVSHDIVVDMNYLMAALNQHHLDYPNCLLSCTHLLSMALYPERQSYSLSSLAETFGVTFQAHHALEDAICASKILLKILENEEVHSLQELHEKYHYSFGQMDKHYYHHMPLYKSTEDTNHRLSKETVCLTGTLSISKEELEQSMQLKGTHTSRNVSYHTSILVVGKKGYWKNRYGKKNAKVNKARYLQSVGQDIKIIHEHTFVKMLKEDKK